MSSLKAYSLGRLIKYTSDTTLRYCGANIYRVSALSRCYTTEERTKEQSTGAGTEAKPTGMELPASIEECHKLIVDVTAELNQLKTQVNELDDKYKRALAEGENIRRRLTKQIQDTKVFAIQSFCKDLLDVADTLDAATETVPEQELTKASPAMKTLFDGVKLTSAQLTQIFARHGLEKVYPLNDKFDPNLHEALFQQEVQGAEPGTVVAVSKTGYKLHDRCVRPALVGVAKSP